MTLITLQIRTNITLATQIKNYQLLFENAKNNLLNGMIYRIWATRSTQTWSDLKQFYPTQVQQLNTEITETASFYLRSIKPKIQNLRDKYQLEYSNYEVEISNVSLNNPETLELAAYYHTKPYNLIQSFGNNLLLSPVNADITNTFETFMVQLNNDLTIHTYTS